jgi:hypothetical protein
MKLQWSECTRVVDTALSFDRPFVFSCSVDRFVGNVTLLCSRGLFNCRSQWPAARSEAWVYGRSLAGIAGSNPAGGMDVCLC